MPTAIILAADQTQRRREAEYSGDRAFRAIPGAQLEMCELGRTHL